MNRFTPRPSRPMPDRGERMSDAAGYGYTGEHRKQVVNRGPVTTPKEVREDER